MSISFNAVPSNLAVPFIAAEFDNSLAAQGPSLLAYKALLLGQKLKSAPAAANTVFLASSADQVATQCGRGSQLHRMALAWFSANQSTELWVGVLSDNPASAYASGTVTVSGTASADGTVYLYFGGEVVQVRVASGDSATAIASAIATAVHKHASGTVTFASAIAADTVTIGGTTFVGTAGAVTPGAATFSIDTGNTQAAASLASQVNAHATAGALVRAVANAAIVTLYAHAGGTGGNSIALASSTGVRLAVSAATLTGANADNALAVHAQASGAVVTLHARNAGAAMNEFDIRVGYYDGDTLPAGVSVAVAPMSGGSSAPVLTSLFAAIGDTWFNIIAHPYTDATSLVALEAELASRSGPMRMIDGLAITAKSDTYGNVSTLGAGRNSPHSVILWTDDSPTQPAEVAANCAAVVALNGAADPARPFQTLPLVWTKPPIESQAATLTERNTLLLTGIATMRRGAGGVAQIERLVTTYQFNTAGTPDASYRDATTMLTLMYLRYSWRARIASRYPRHKLASDTTIPAAGQAIITPKLGRAEAYGWFRDMEALGLVENFDAFKANLVVERNATDPNRLDFLLPPDLINSLIVVATKVQFRL